MRVLILIICLLFGISVFAQDNTINDDCIEVIANDVIADCDTFTSASYTVTGLQTGCNYTVDATENDTLCICPKLSCPDDTTFKIIRELVTAESVVEYCDSLPCTCCEYWFHFGFQLDEIVLSGYEVIDLLTGDTIATNVNNFWLVNYLENLGLTEGDNQYWRGCINEDDLFYISENNYTPSLADYESSGFKTFMFAGNLRTTLSYRYCCEANEPDPCAAFGTDVQGLCDYVLANPDSELALSDCDKGGIDNITECTNGDNPFIEPDVVSSGVTNWNIIENAGNYTFTSNTTICDENYSSGLGCNPTVVFYSSGAEVASYDLGSVIYNACDSFTMPDTNVPAVYDDIEFDCR